MGCITDTLFVFVASSFHDIVALTVCLCTILQMECCGSAFIEWCRTHKNILF